MYCAPEKKCGLNTGAQSVSATVLRAAGRWHSRGREPPELEFERGLGPRMSTSRATQLQDVLGAKGRLWNRSKLFFAPGKAMESQCLLFLATSDYCSYVRL